MNRAKHLGNMKSSKALARWSGCFIALQAEESMGAGVEGIPGRLTNCHTERERTGGTMHNLKQREEELSNRKSLKLCFGVHHTAS